MPGSAPTARGSSQAEAERELARRVLAAEAAAVTNLAEALGAEFHRACDLIEACARAGGSVLITGLGKSGLIGTKISATMASLGIPSHAVHPSEAAHGDLGRFRKADLVLAISYSGQTEEVVNLCAIVRQDGLPIISITGGPAVDDAAPSSLARLSTVALRLGRVTEAGDFVLAPTASTTATLALGDALALCVARRRNFTGQDFARHHPGGTLGTMLRPVREMLRFVAGKNLPIVPDSVTVRQALDRAAELARRPGAVLLVDSTTGVLTGIFTDGDLRRLILRDPAELSRPVRDVMTRAPRTLPEGATMGDAARLFREFRADEIPVVDGAGKPVGLLDVQDLVAMRLVND
ncbi:MAG: KpsF/GutQ family sugar-phosphate isomerase [Phycisphaerae bacterium]|nr:KpsF/GutQ family sugar-phosphate isomerase [Phycisphaerae bacterium]